MPSDERRKLTAAWVNMLAAGIVSKVWRDDLDERLATIRMRVWCRGRVMMIALIDARKRIVSR